VSARTLFVAGVTLVGVAACTAGEGPPTPGTYTVQFPSTAAAVATDFVQVLIFDVKTPADRAGICQELISARIRGEKQTPSVDPPAPAANICEMLAGRKPVPIPYGEKALLVIAQRKDTKTDTVQDFMIGCAVMTVGDGDAPLPVPLRIISLKQSVPDTQCGSVGEYCQDKCR
jgi:hypothetical protein